MSQETPTTTQETQKHQEHRKGRLPELAKVGMEFVLPIAAGFVARRVATELVRAAHPEGHPAKNEALLSEIAELGQDFEAFVTLPEDQRKVQSEAIAASLQNAAAVKLVELGFSDAADLDIFAKAISKHKKRAHIEEVGMRVLIRSKLEDPDVLENDVNTPELTQSLHGKAGKAVEVGNAALQVFGGRGAKLNHEQIAATIVQQQMNETTQLVAKQMGIDVSQPARADQQTIMDILSDAEKTIIDNSRRREKRRVKKLIESLNAEQKASLRGAVLILAAVDALSQQTPDREALALVYLTNRVTTKRQARQVTQPSN